LPLQKNNQTLLIELRQCQFLLSGNPVAQDGYSLVIEICWNLGGFGVRCHFCVANLHKERDGQAG
jgi:hypothetical protein